MKVSDIEQESDKRGLAEIPALPWVMVYGQSAQEAIARAKALALRVLAEPWQFAPLRFLIRSRWKTRRIKQ